MARPKTSSMRITENMKRFAHNYVNERMNAADAYQNAYDTSYARHAVTQRAHELLKRPHVAALVNELRRQQGDMLHVSIPSLALEIEEIKALAMEKGQYATALNAVISKGKLFGFWENKEAARLGDLTEAEALDILEKAGIETRRMNH